MLLVHFDRDSLLVLSHAVLRLYVHSYTTSRPLFYPPLLTEAPSGEPLYMFLLVLLTMINLIMSALDHCAAKVLLHLDSGLSIGLPQPIPILPTSSSKALFYLSLRQREGIKLVNLPRKLNG